MKEERWYTFSPIPFENEKEDREAEHELLTLYRDAVRRHLLSDVPVGILLSGGLDSGLLLALMKEMGDNWPAYTVGYGDSFHDDELRDAAESAKLLGARHVPVQLSQQEFESSLPHIIASLEEPITASSVVPMYFVCQRARQDVKVVLLGQGPDELFGGYKRHLGVHYGNAWRQLPKPMRSASGGVVHRLPRNETLKRGVHALAAANDRLARYEDVFSLLPRSETNDLFNDDLHPQIEAPGRVEYWQTLLPDIQQTDELGGFQHLEIRSALPDELLMYADKLSMAHGLEARVPYLDRTVVEFAQRLKASHKIRYGTRKWLHRQVCRSFLPRQILERKKRGFAVNVVDSWFNDSFSGKMVDLLQDPKSLMFNYLKPSSVRSLLQDHVSRRHDNHKILFSLVMVEYWLRGASSPAPAVA